MPKLLENSIKKKEFVPIVVEKTKEAYDRISARLSNSFMFSSLDDKDKDIVVKAMRENKFSYIFVFIF